MRDLLLAQNETKEQNTASAREALAGIGLAPVMNMIDGLAHT
jgi:hypothetical protein